MELNSLRYIGYTTGIYGKHKTGGVTLQFICETTCINYYVIFNVDLRRKRNTKKHKAGSPLPSGRFSVGLRSQFYKFWISTGLGLPHRLSAFNDCMGKLKAFTFCATVTKGKRLDSGTLATLMSKPPKLMVVSNSVPTAIQQLPNKIPTRIANNDSPPPPVIGESQENQTTCLNNYGISKQGTTDTRIPITPITTTDTVREQTNDQWLADADAYF
tara:strand:- start:494 stop:1138 length:645 start_codon:yes stop_codon:yes gene_type:complete